MEDFILEEKTKYIASNYWTALVIPEALKWHKEVERYSFSRIPNALFEYAKVLDLSSAELGFLCILLSHMRYTKEKMPSKIYPSLARMADCKIANTRKTLSVLANSIQEKGLIRIVKVKGENSNYDPAGLFAILHHMVEKDKEIKERLDYQYKEGTIKDRTEADNYRFNELKLQTELIKRRLGLV